MYAARVVAVSLALLAASAYAQTDAESPPSGDRGGPPPMSAEMKAAFEVCKAQGRPGGTAFDACMSSKGYTRPEGGSKPPRQ